MSTYRQIVSDAGDLLNQHSIGRLAHVAQYWQAMEWVEHQQQLLDTEAEVSRTGEAFVCLYPKLLQHPEAKRLVLGEFGLFLLAKGGERAKAIWDQKLCTPDKQHIEQFAQRLADPETRKTIETYEALVSAYPPKGHAVERLVAIHLCNALKHHNIAFPDSIGVDIRQWGPTSEFANGKKYFSLVPLISAYAPRRINESFGCAFADLIGSDLKTVIESSVAYALKAIILNVIQRSA